MLRLRIAATCPGELCIFSHCEDALHPDRQRWCTASTPPALIPRSWAPWAALECILLILVGVRGEDETQLGSEFSRGGRVQCPLPFTLVLLSCLALSACAGTSAKPPAYASAVGPPGAPDTPHRYAVERPAWSSPEEIEQHTMSRMEPRTMSRNEQHTMSRTSHPPHQPRYRNSYQERSAYGQVGYRHHFAAAQGPARTVLETAARMIELGTPVKGSCYDYVDAVFKEAGHDDWRRREKVYRKPKKGPYVNLDRVKPGDWLWLVKYREGAHIRTHSVLFVGWQNRSQGIAHVFSHPGQGRAVSGRFQTYDVSKTYNITRPTIEDRQVGYRKKRKRSRRK